MSFVGAFTDPVYLANYGINRATVLEYFLHLLNPFRTKAKLCNDLLVEEQTSIGFLMQNGIGMRPGPMSLTQAEEEFSGALARMTGEQYEFLKVQDPEESINSPLFTIRHVYRSSPTKVTALGIYYVLKGVIYKSPSARSLMKASVTRTCQGLIDACDALKKFARYFPRTRDYWAFESSAKRNLEETESDIVNDLQKRTKMPSTSSKKFPFIFLDLNLALLLEWFKSSACASIHDWHTFEKYDGKKWHYSRGRRFHQRVLKPPILRQRTIPAQSSWDPSRMETRHVAVPSGQYNLCQDVKGPLVLFVFVQDYDIWKKTILLTSGLV